MAPFAKRAFPAIRDHVLLPCAGSVLEADAALAPVLDRAVLSEVVDLVPDDWLDDEPDARRTAYVDYLDARLEGPRQFALEAERAR
jgi:hypothetical protein